MPSYTILYETSEDSLRLFSIISELTEQPDSILALPLRVIKLNTALLLHIN